MPTEPCPDWKSGSGDQKFPRTLDERQVEDQDIPELEERELRHAPLWFEQEAPHAYIVRDKEIVGTEEVVQAASASRMIRDDLPYEGLITVGEFLLGVVVFSTTLWLAWWAFGYEI